MLDAICIFHEYKCAFDSRSHKIEDDKLFKQLITNRLNLSTGNGFTGPTYFEKQSL